MTGVLKKCFLILLFFFNFLTLLLPWYSDTGIRELNGISIVSSNLTIFSIIIATYFISIIFYEKKPKLFFTLGLISLLMFLAMDVSKIFVWKSYTLKCIGLYVAIIVLILNAVFYIYILAKSRN